MAPRRFSDVHKKLARLVTRNLCDGANYASGDLASAMGCALTRSMQPRIGPSQMTDELHVRSRSGLQTLAPKKGNRRRGLVQCRVWPRGD